jgi:hypothetical protein
MSQKPKNINSASEKELDKVEEQFKQFESEVKDMTMDRLNATPKEETEQQTKLSQKEISAKKDNYLKPIKVISCREKFDEKWRADYEFQKEYVQFIAENKELIGESIDIWTRPFPGMPAEEWLVPVNTPVWGPRYLAEQIKRKFYHRLIMKETPTESTGAGIMYGKMAADTTIQRLDAVPVSKRKSVFMGDKNF